MNHFIDTIESNGQKYRYYSIKKAEEKNLGNFARLPYSLKVLLENQLRFVDDVSVTQADISAIGKWLERGSIDHEIAFRPARVLFQDFTGVPAVADLCAMRDAMAKLNKDPSKVNPQIPVDLVVDHSVMVDKSSNKDAFAMNVAREFQRNGERYAFLRWAQDSFNNLRVVPPGTGICHQVNLEYLASVVCCDNHQQPFAYIDTVVGADSHTTMINGLGVLGWGVGGIEAEAAMLGQPVSMLIPEVVGFYLDGKMSPGVTATDLVLRVVEMLRKHGVVAKFVEFYGPGVDNLSLADRATISNMAPEYGATCGIFAVDNETLQYMRLTGRSEEQINLVETYMRAQGMFRTPDQLEPIFSSTLSLDLSTIKPAIAGPKRPQDRVLLEDAPTSFMQTGVSLQDCKKVALEGSQNQLEDGAVVIAAITSCTNTSNPSVLIAAGLLAQKAISKGLTVKPWVKTSLAPGSQVVSDYLAKSGLDKALDQLGFYLVGYGCTTCIGNSGPLADPIAQAIEAHDLTVCAVLSGNRNFEGRVHPHVQSNYLASPPLVVAYALAGSLYVNLDKDPIGQDSNGKQVMLKDIWPSEQEIQSVMSASLSPDMFKTRYQNVFEGPKAWQDIKVSTSALYPWDNSSTYVHCPPFFEDMKQELDPIQDIKQAKILLMLGDSITTDHISPAGSFRSSTPAGNWLQERQVRPTDYNSYGARRGNHHVMMRGTFANIRIRNELVPGTEGGYALYRGKQVSVFEAAQSYAADQTPLIVIAGKAYGTGSSRDWAAKGTRLLGVRAVIAESFERIHRSNLIGMGVLPLQFSGDDTRETLNIKGDETFDIEGIADRVSPKMELACTIHYGDGSIKNITLRVCIDTEDEANYYKHGGILHYVLRNMISHQVA